MSRNHYTTIFSIKISNGTKQDTLDVIRRFLHEEKFHQIATVGPEFLLEAQKNNAFHEVLNSCDLCVPDGFGIRVATWILRIKNLFRSSSSPYKLSPISHKLQIYPGIDLMWDILKIANEKNLSVFLVAKDDGLSTWEETAEAIKAVYPDLTIGGENVDLQQGQGLGTGRREEHDYSLPAYRTGRLTTNYQLIFCSLGAPQQELFLAGLKDATMGSVRLTMGVGGAFDYITGKVPRAPRFMQKAGLEWLFRLLAQPHRWKRIWNAVVVFPVNVLFSKDEPV